MAKHSTVQAAIKSLAVSYHAYNTAVCDGDSNGIVVWGECLVEDQEATGVELFPSSNIRRHMDLHREAAREQVKAALGPELAAA